MKRYSKGIEDFDFPSVDVRLSSGETSRPETEYEERSKVGLTRTSGLSRITV